MSTPTRLQAPGTHAHRISPEALALDASVRRLDPLPVEAKNLQTAVERLRHVAGPLLEHKMGGVSFALRDAVSREMATVSNRVQTHDVAVAQEIANVSRTAAAAANKLDDLEHKKNELNKELDAAKRKAQVDADDLKRKLDTALIDNSLLRTRVEDLVQELSNVPQPTPQACCCNVM